jgi:SAM-dependent methyltransferase
MRMLDRTLQRWRFRAARPWVPRGGRILDVGCHKGEFLAQLGDNIRTGLGFDPRASAQTNGTLSIVAERFSTPSSLPDGSMDAVILLATLEHIRDKAPLIGEFWRVLAPAGRVIVTVPAPFVDRIVALLCRLRLADGMSLEEHHGFPPDATPPIFFEQGFELEHWGQFQLGLNNLFVFRKPAPVNCVVPACAASSCPAT